MTNMLINQNVPIVSNKNTSRKHLAYKGLHLKNYGSSRMAMNKILVIKKLWNGTNYSKDYLEYLYSEAKITNRNTNMYSRVEQSSSDNSSFMDENEETSESTSLFSKLKTMRNDWLHKHKFYAK